MSVRTRPRKTVEDLMRLPEETRAELIDGEIYAMAAPSLRHQRVLLHLAVELHAYARGRGEEALTAPFDVHLPSGDVVQPDIVYVHDPRRIAPDALHGVPDVAIEVVSARHPERDRFVKRVVYERNQVPEYWVVEPVERAIQVLRLHDARFAPAGWFTAGTVLRTEALPDFELPIDPLFATD